MSLMEKVRETISWAAGVFADLGRMEQLGRLAVLAIMASVSVGVVLFVVDPNVHSLTDGVWSAWVTMTHVGFGDVVPASLLGRLLASLLIVFGFVLFSFFTAFISVALIGRNPHVMGLQKVEEELPDEGSTAKILTELARLHSKMVQLEDQLASMKNTEKTGKK